MANVGEIRATLTLESTRFQAGLQNARNQLALTSTAAQATDQAIDSIGQGSIISATQLASLRALQAQLGQTSTRASATSLALSSINNTQIIGPNVTNNITNMNNGLSNTSTHANRARDSMKKLHNVALGMSAAVGVAFAASIATAANFEQKMKDVEAVAGATGTEMQQLGELAKDMGAKTAFSATEAAMSIEELVKAGLTVTQILDGGLQGALDLATAGGLQLAEAAEIASTALNAFRDDNMKVADAANILAGAANASATDVHELKYGLSAVSAVAAGMGMSFQDTSTALAVFANNGLKGSDAGTSLKTMLSNLEPTTKKTIELFHDLGWETENGTNAFYDNEGSLRSISEISGILHDGLKDMADQQRALTLETIFGSDAVRAGNILYKEGADGLNNMWDAMSKVTAAEVAATKLDTLKGSFEELKGVVETIGIEVGEGFLPVLKDITDAITDFLRSLDAADLANAKSALAFAGIAAAIATVLSAIAKVGFALSAFALTPVGAAIIGLSLLGGAFVAAKMHQSEMSEVTLDSVVALEKQRDELSKNIAAYDDLKSKSQLTNEQLARFVDINSEISKTADPTIIAKLKDEQGWLAEKSGLSNEQLAELIRLNGEILKVVPESNTTLSEQGNVLLNNTDAAKRFNDQQLEMIRLELEAKKTKAEANMAGYLEDEKKLMSDMKDLKIEMNGYDVKEFNQKDKLRTLESELATAKLNNDTLEQERLNGLIERENHKLESIKKQRAESAQAILNKQIEIDKVQAQIGKLDEVKRKMIDIELRQVGLNSKRGEELKTIDSAISKLETQKQKIQNNTTAADKNTQEYREAVAAIDKQISELGTVRGRVIGITSEAGNMNAALGKDINKTITINQRAGRTIAAVPGQGRGNVGSQFHTGGVLPKLHVGGLASQFASAPSHNEIDIRALRGEMILTEAQQANLHRMIDAGFTNNGGNSSAQSPSVTQSNTVNITVEGNLDTDLYDELMRKQTWELDRKLIVAGVKGR